MTNETSGGLQPHMSAAPSDGATIQQGIMRQASRMSQEQSEEESDVLMMDDVQFTASLDRLLDNELVHSAYNPSASLATGGGTANRGVVSTDPSVASSTSSTVHNHNPHVSNMQSSGGSSNHSSGGSSHSSRGSSLPPPSGAPARQALLPPPQAHTQAQANNPMAALAAAMAPSPLTQRLAFAMPMSVAPATVRSSVSINSGAMKQPSSSRTTYGAGTKRRRGQSLPPGVSEDESERERRRQDRNLREQQRSRRITEQISVLRDVLTEAGVPCKPDKNSILISVHEYIVQLQSRSDMLDAEHKKLLDTIARTNEMVNNQYFQASTDGTTSSSVVTSDAGTAAGGDVTMSNDLLSDANNGNNTVLADEDVVLVQGLDYKSVFNRCGIALAVASIDGRFIDCNSEFVALSGYSRNELLPGGVDKPELNPGAGPCAKTPDTITSDPAPRNLSLFNLLNREDMEKVFTAMSGMLRRPVVRDPSAPPQEDSDNLSTQQDHWSGFVRQNHEGNTDQLRMNITLVRTPSGRPKFFNCSLTTAADCE